MEAKSRILKVVICKSLLMKKIVVVLVYCIIPFLLFAQANLCVYKVGGSIVSYPATQVENITFVDSEESLDGSRGYPYVDLGLPSGKKWAVHNIGASMPEEDGDCFAWGDVRGRSNSKHCYVTSQWGMSSFCAKYVGDKNVLEPVDDAAFANWGGNWRMPTIGDFEELVECCTWILGSMNGIEGYKVISKTNGNSLFLPMGPLWSSNCDYNDDGDYALALLFLIVNRSSTPSNYMLSREEFLLCFPVRPILP